MARTWRERVDEFKDAFRAAGDPSSCNASNGDWILDDRLVNMNVFSREAIQARRELEREALAWLDPIEDDSPPEQLDPLMAQLRDELARLTARQRSRKKRLLRRPRKPRPAWRERVERVKADIRAAFDPQPGTPDSERELLDRLITVPNGLSKEGHQAWREIGRERDGA